MGVHMDNGLHGTLHTVTPEQVVEVPFTACRDCMSLSARRWRPVPIPVRRLVTHMPSYAGPPKYCKQRPFKACQKHGFGAC